MPFYHVWFTTANDQPYLTGDSASRARGEMERAAQAAHYEVHAASVAPNHVHLVLHLDGDDDLDTAVRVLRDAGARNVVDLPPSEVWAPSYGHRRVPLVDLARVVRQVNNTAESHEH